MGAEDSPRDARKRLQPLTLVGVLLLAFGVLSLGWVGWQYYGTNVTSTKAFESERTKLRDSWQQPATAATPAPGASATPARPAPGDAIALMRIPDFGNDYEIPIVAGTGDGELSRGIGWYTSTALPGELGNFAVAGHRITHGEPFARLLELKVGSKVLVETREATYTYELTTSPDSLTVTDDEAWVIDPVPGKPVGTQPTERMITLTTCTDLFASPKRSVAFGRLVEIRKK